MTLPEYDVAAVQSGYAANALSAVELCQAYLDRIARIDRSGPTLRSIAELNPDAKAIAESLDQERLDTGARSALHGAPILVKDNIDTGDTMATMAGSLAMAGNIAPHDAFVVDRLRRAGAVLLGKTNLSEWAFFRSIHGISGWSSRGGQVVNPYALDRTPSGSSSGSAVAVAANLCVAAIGTETDGSIISPASVNGIVGLKPTVGLVGRSGIVPIADAQDTAGPMARTVADVAAVLTAIAGHDPNDPATDHPDHPGSVDYRGFLGSDGLKGVRLGVARDFFGRDRRVDAIIEDGVARLSALGATIVDPVGFPTLYDVSASERLVFLVEFKAGINRYLADHDGASVGSLAEIIDFNRRHADRVMPLFGQQLLELAEETSGLADPDYLAAKADCRRLARDEGIDLALQTHKLDAIVAPSTDPAWLIDTVLGDGIVTSGAPRSYNLPAVAGYPHITVPAGFVGGLPVGLSLFGGAFQEGKLIRYAHAFEQATKARRPPTFAPSLNAGR